MPHNEFHFIAQKKFMAVHPPGSGIEVVYEIGDDVPAGEWGRAAEMMVESGKLARQAYLVSDPGDEPQGAVPGSPLPPTEQSAVEVNAGTDPSFAPDARPGSEWPKRTERKGFFLLSDGSTLYGKNKAVAAQDALDEAAKAPLGIDEGAGLGEPPGAAGEAGDTRSAEQQHADELKAINDASGDADEGDAAA